jgi:hypothetical protein
MMKLFSTVLLILLSGFAARKAQAENPILPGYADPHMRVWDGKMYLSVGKDETPDKPRFSIIYWSIYSSTNLVDWELECHVDPADTYLGKGYNKCWASDIARKDGFYYLYTSNGGSETSVFRAEKPNGPYLDILKKPMLPHSMSINHEYDPTIFTEDDGQNYIIFGRDGMLHGDLLHYQIGKLSDDMLSIDGETEDLITTRKYGFGDAKRARDHQYFHKHGDLYYLSCAGAYMTSTNRTGPFENFRHTGQNGHSSFNTYHGQDYLCHEYTCEPYGVRQFRQVNLVYLHYKDNGDMIADKAFLQESNVAKEGKHYKTGVGNYDAAWERIEAEWFFKISNAWKKESPNGGFEIQQIGDGAYLNFPLMKNMKTNSTIDFELSSESGATIEVRNGGPDGQLLGTCEVPNTGSFKTYKTVSCPLKNDAGTHDLYFVFKGKAADLLHLDGFGIESGSF